MIQEIKKQIIELCEQSIKPDLWKKHIKEVVKYSLILGEKLNADLEVLEIAAWIHDISKVKDDKEEKHHIIGCDEAEKILSKYKYPKEKLELIKECILCHSSDENYVPKSLEAQIVYNADGLSAFDMFIAFFFSAFKKGLSVKETQIKMQEKVEKVWRKITLPEAREIKQAKYEAIKLLLEEEY